jgi:hypothetical protein
VCVCVCVCVCVVLCAVFLLIIVLFCVMCVICMLCLTVVPLLPGKTPFAIRSLHINNTTSCQIQFMFPIGCMRAFDKFYETLRDTLECIHPRHSCFFQSYIKS